MCVRGVATVLVLASAVGHFYVFLSEGVGLLAVLNRVQVEEIRLVFLRTTALVMAAAERRSRLDKHV